MIDKAYFDAADPVRPKLASHSVWANACQTLGLNDNPPSFLSLHRSTDLNAQSTRAPRGRHLEGRGASKELVLDRYSLVACDSSKPCAIGAQTVTFNQHLSLLGPMISICKTTQLEF